MERYCEAAVQALSGAGPLPRASSSHGRETRRRRDFFASPCSSPHLSTERLLCFGVAVVGNTEENSNSLLFGFNRKEGVQVTGKEEQGFITFCGYPQTVVKLFFIPLQNFSLKLCE